MNEDKTDERRLTEGSLHHTVSNDLVIRRKPLKKQTKFRKRVKASKAEYTFLQFHHAIWKWATENHNLTGRELSILLYVYPLITFTSKEFKECMKELSSSDASTLVKFRKEGWVNEWSKTGRVVNYVLSSKANTLCARLHRMYMLEEQIPTSARRNVIVRKSKNKGNDLMDLFKKFNNKVKEKQENDKRREYTNRKKRSRRS